MFFWRGRKAWALQQFASSVCPVVGLSVFQGCSGGCHVTSDLNGASEALSVGSNIGVIVAELNLFSTNSIFHKFFQECRI